MACVPAPVRTPVRVRYPQRSLSNKIDSGEAPVLFGACVLYAIAAVLALLASVGIGPFGPFALADLALAFLGAGLVACHLPGTVIHHA
jgi:hypothetical protein